MCTVHLINDGVTVNGNTATVEFASSGPATTFQCSLDSRGFSSCEFVLVTYILVVAGLVPRLPHSFLSLAAWFFLQATGTWARAWERGYVIAKLIYN